MKGPYSDDDKGQALAIMHGEPTGPMDIDQLERVLDILEIVKAHRG